MRRSLAFWNAYAMRLVRHTSRGGVWNMRLPGCPCRRCVRGVW